MGQLALGARAFKLQVLEHLSEDKPHYADYDEWIGIEADRIGVEESEVRRIVGDYLDRAEAMVTGRQQTSSQRIADVIGATKAAALRTLTGGLNAVKPYIQVSIVEGKEVQEHVMLPDWRARIPAAQTILHVQGSILSPKLEISVNNQEEHLSDAELNRRIIDLAKQSLAEGTGDTTPGEDGPPVFSRPLLLGNRSHQDQGRTGYPQPLQAVPQAKVPPPGPTATDGPKGRGGKHLQKQDHDDVLAGKPNGHVAVRRKASNKDSVPKRGRGQGGPRRNKL